jgi:hypothetical protein
VSYVNPDYKTKKEFKKAVGDGIKHLTYNPSGMFPTPQNGTDIIEGPHYPKPHRWYAAVVIEHGFVTKVKG